MPWLKTKRWDAVLCLPTARLGSMKQKITEGRTTDDWRASQGLKCHNRCLTERRATSRRRLAWTETTNRSARTCTVNSLRRPQGIKPSLCFPTSNKALTHFPSKRSLGFATLAFATITQTWLLISDVLSHDHLFCDTQAEPQVSAHEYFAVIHYKCLNGHLGSTSQLLVAIKARLNGMWGGVKTM